MPGRSARQLLLWLLGRRKRFRVAGPSMLPTLAEGQTVLVDPSAYRRRRPQPGDVVLAEHPLEQGLLVIKRVAELRESGAFLLGDNPDTTSDSRDFGPVSFDRLQGRVVCTLT